MTVPTEEPSEVSESRLVRAAIWVAIGALVAAAVVCVLWVLLGDGDGIVGRALLTILLLAAFAGVAILDARLAHARPAWFALASMVTWVVALLLGAFLIWMPEAEFRYASGVSRFASFLLIVLVLQLALLHVRLYMKSHDRNPTVFVRATTYVTIGLVVVLAAMLVFALAFAEFVDLPDLYWRWIVAVAILAAVGTALVPLVNALFAPRRSRNRQHSVGSPSEPAPWPTYADGVTPLPYLPDGLPDWSAYYTGYPSAASQVFLPLAPAPTPDGPPDTAPWWSVDSTVDASPGTTEAPAHAQPGSAPEPGPRRKSNGDFPPPATPSGYEGYPPPPPLPR